MHLRGLGRVVELPGGEASAVTRNRDLGVTRLDPDLPGGIRWRRAIDLG